MPSAGVVRGSDVVRVVSGHAAGESLDVAFVRARAGAHRPGDARALSLAGRDGPHGTWSGRSPPLEGRRDRQRRVSADHRRATRAGRPPGLRATWCAPCRVVVPKLGALQGRYGAQGLSVVGVSTEDAQDVALFAQRASMPYPVGVDRHAETTRSYGVVSLPTLVIIDRRGVVRDVAIGYDSSEEHASRGSCVPCWRSRSPRIWLRPAWGNTASLVDLGPSAGLPRVIATGNSFSREGSSCRRGDSILPSGKTRLPDEEPPPSSPEDPCLPPRRPCPSRRETAAPPRGGSLLPRARALPPGEEDRTSSRGRPVLPARRPASPREENALEPRGDRVLPAISLTLPLACRSAAPGSRPNMRPDPHAWPRGNDRPGRPSEGPGAVGDPMSPKQRTCILPVSAVRYPACVRRGVARGRPQGDVAMNR